MGEWLVLATTLTCIKDRYFLHFSHECEGCTEVLATMRRFSGFARMPAKQHNQNNVNYQGLIRNSFITWNTLQSLHMCEFSVSANWTTQRLLLCIFIVVGSSFIYNPPFRNYLPTQILQQFNEDGSIIEVFG